MLLNQGKTKIETLLGGYLTKMAVGTGNAAVTGTETSLTEQKNVSVTSCQVDYPSQGYVTFNATIDDSVSPMTIQEVGLVDINNNLCYRAVISAVTKVNGQSININYQIKVQ